ncbi:hypothetical protein SAMN04487926_16710 [Paraburkholderia steynii]|uniref:Uncharacterized protein n=1 Tax=Paraburkholderia steynii TaxID=1245441 RepID=A0A7Z7BM97_9BURK|nr:hypothetical protein SAMN04487926_16710 [Paraburkholderia steynii]
MFGYTDWDCYVRSEHYAENVRRDVEECAYEVEEKGDGFTGSGMKNAY